MKILITGVTGFLGRSMAADLSAKGYRIAGSSRRRVTMPGVEIVEAELGGRIEPAIFADCDAIIHAAHDFAPGSMTKNLEGTLAMRDAAAKAGISRQIFLTSYSARPDAESEYGRTKFAIERLFTDPGSATLRLGLVIGNGGLFARQRAILLRTPIVPIVGAGISPVPIVALSHVLAATDVILHQRLSGSQNLFYDARPTLKEFVQAVKKQAGQRALLLPIGMRFAEAALKVATSIGLPIPADPGQLRALQRNEDACWQSDLPTLLPTCAAEFQLSYALDQLNRVTSAPSP